MTLAILSASFTRPNDVTAYTSGDLVANDTTAGNVVPMSFTSTRNAGGNFRVNRARISKSTAGVANCSLRLHLYTTSPVPSNGDNGVYVTTLHTAYIGKLDFTMLAFSAGAAAWSVAAANAGIAGRVGAAGTVYGLIEARGAYTPGAEEVFTTTLEIEEF